MPILPGETQRKIKRRHLERGGPDRMGEEGILHIVTVGDERYFAKQWYNVGEKRLITDPASETSTASPYWHKVKFYEEKLINAAFPDVTVQMAAAYDPRIQKNPAGQYEFDYSAGRPVTLTKEVKADAALMQQRDAITNPLYDHMLSYHQVTQYGYSATPDERREFYRLITEANDKLDQLFGNEAMALNFTVSGQAPPRDITINNAREIAQRASVKNYPNSLLARFWRYGILAIHPQVNFIPEGKDAITNTVQGRYIELGIFDIDRFIQQWQQDHTQAEMDALLPKLKRYELARTLDDLFDRIVTKEYFEGDWTCYQPEVKAAVFQVTEAIRRKCEEYSLVLLSQLYGPTLAETDRIVQRNPAQQSIIAGFTDLAKRITAIPVDQ